MNELKKRWKKDFLPDFFLALLIFLLFFQGKFLWISFQPAKEIKRERIQTDEIINEVLMPQKLVLNYGPRDHMVRYRFQDLWQENREEVTRILTEARPQDLTAISREDFLACQKDPSIVFKYKGPLSGSILINLMDQDNHREDHINIPLDAIYLSKSNEVILAGGGKYYRLRHQNNTLDIEEILKEHRDLENYYLTFEESFQIKKDLLLPKYDVMTLEKIHFTSGLLHLEKEVKSNLAERFLGASIDYIREIYQEDRINYVLDNKFLSLTEDGLISYTNEEDFVAEDRNLYKSLNEALAFISSKTGLSTQIYLEKLVPVETKSNLGYKFYFNLKENGYPVIPLSEEKSFIEVEVYSDHVKSYQEVYRKKVEDPSYRQEYVRMLPLYNILTGHLDLFQQETTEDVLQNIDYLSIVYIDPLKGDNALLKPALEVHYSNMSYYFDLKTGALIMKRGTV